MNFADMKKLLEFYVDDVVENDIAVMMFNEGKDEMAVAANAVFPDIRNSSDDGDEFVFDKRFHRLPVLYAAAMVKAYDSSIREKESYMVQFQNGLKDFVQKCEIPPQYKKSVTTQHFTITNPNGQSEFTITSDFFDTYGNREVYVNSEPVDAVWQGNRVTLTTPAPQGSVVSVMWDPPYLLAQPYVKGWW